MRRDPRFISTRVHGALDIAMAVLLVASPWIIQFDHGSVETWLPILIGGGGLLYSLFTNYEWAVARRLPMPIHLLLDAGAGLFLALSPWIFGFDHFVWQPHVWLGLSEVAVAATTSPYPSQRSYMGVLD